MAEVGVTLDLFDSNGSLIGSLKNCDLQVGRGQVRDDPFFRMYSQNVSKCSFTLSSVFKK